MKQHVTTSAKSLIKIIGAEWAMSQKRVDLGYTKQDRMFGFILERLNMLAIHNLSLRKLLDDTGHIPFSDDHDRGLPWAEDKRDPRDQDVIGKRERYKAPLKVSSS